MSAYLDQAISLPEYRKSKAALINEKRSIEDELVALTKNVGGWFEPAIPFVNAAKQAVFMAQSNRDDEKRDFLKTNGSNLTITNRQLSAVPRGPWKLLENNGRIAHNDIAAQNLARRSVVNPANVFQSGETGIRTPDTGLTPYNGLANRRLQPLGHLSRNPLRRRAS